MVWLSSLGNFSHVSCVMTSFDHHETHVNNAQCVDNAAGEAQDVLNHQKTWKSGRKFRKKIDFYGSIGGNTSWNECGFVGDQPTNWKRPQLNKLQTQGEKTIGDANMILILCSMCICIYWYETPKDISIIWLKTQGYFRISSRGEIFVSTGKLRCTIQPGPNIHWCQTRCETRGFQLTIGWWNLSCWSWIYQSFHRNLRIPGELLGWLRGPFSTHEKGVHVRQVDTIQYEKKPNPHHNIIPCATQFSSAKKLV